MFVSSACSNLSPLFHPSSYSSLSSTHSISLPPFQQNTRKKRKRNVAFAGMMEYGSLGFRVDIDSVMHVGETIWPLRLERGSFYLDVRSKDATWFAMRRQPMRC